MSKVAARNGHPVLLSFKDVMSLIREVYPLHNLCGCIPNYNKFIELEYIRETIKRRIVE